MVSILIFRYRILYTVFGIRRGVNEWGFVLYYGKGHQIFGIYFFFTFPHLLQAPLHVYVCLALLQYHSEKLMELERAEILEFLAKLPPTPIEKVTNLAVSVCEDVLSRKLLVV